MTLATLLTAVLLAQEPTEIPWEQNPEEAIARAKTDGRPIAVYLSADWCSVCRALDSGALRDPEVLSLSPRLRWTRVDIDRQADVAARLSADELPRLDLIDADGVTRLRMRGLMEGPALAAAMRLFLESPTRIPGEPSLTEITGRWAVPLAPIPNGFRSKANCWSHVGYGPLTLGSMSPFQSLRFGLQPRTPSTLSQDRIEVRSLVTWVNLWAFNRGDYLIDFEMERSSLAVGYGLTDTLQLELEVVEARRFGGNLDGLIQSFHDLVNIDQDHRDEFKRGDFQFDIEATSDSPKISLTNDDKGVFLRDLVVTLQHNVTCGTEDWPALAWSLTIRRDLIKPDDLRGGGPADVAFSVSAARRFGDWHVYTALGATFFGDQEFRGIELRSSQVSWLLAGEWRFRPRVSLLLQYLLTSGVAVDFDHFADPSHEVTVGFKFEAALGAVVEIGIVENVVILANSPDFGIHAGLTLRF